MKNYQTTMQPLSPSALPSGFSVSVVLFLFLSIVLLFCIHSPQLNCLGSLSPVLLLETAGRQFS